MNMKEAYDQILQRVHLPENYSKYDAICSTSDLCKEDALIWMHMSHIREYLAILEKDGDQLISVSCASALRKVNELLDQQGWAK